MKKIFYLIVFIVLASACSDNKAVQKSAKDRNEPPVKGEAIPVRLAEAQTREVAAPVHAAGLVACENEARLSFKTGGIIRKIYVEEGQSVQAGQLLATLDLTEINAQATQAVEAFAKAERDLQRVMRLHADSVATLEQLQNATTAYSVARQNVEITKFNQSYSEIRATSAGKIVRKLMNEGELVAPGTPVLFLQATGLQNYVIRIGVADKDRVRLQIGDSAVVRFDAYPGQEWSGKVTGLAQAADPVGNLYQVEIKLTAANPPALVTGFFASVTIYPTMSQLLVVIPIDAIVEGRGNEAFIFIPKDGKAKKLPVKIAFMSNNEVFIASGLQGNEKIITAGSAYLTDNVNISIMQ
jgi:RND family efflux transporter MFP subunit